MCFFESWSTYTHSIYRVRLQVEQLLPNLGNPPIGAICALTGFGVENLMSEVASAHDRWRRRIPTGLLNSWLRWVERVRWRHRTPLFSLFWIVIRLHCSYFPSFYQLSKVYFLFLVLIQNTRTTTTQQMVVVEIDYYYPYTPNFLHSTPPLGTSSTV